MAKPVASSYHLWPEEKAPREIPITHGRITLIRAATKDQFPELETILEIWSDIYASMTPKTEEEETAALSGMLLANRILRNLSIHRKHGRGFENIIVFVAEDCKGVAQAIMRVKCSEKVVEVEDLLVAPWNNSHCRSCITDELCLEPLGTLEKKHHLMTCQLIAPAKGSGTLMMAVLYKLAQIALIERLKVYSSAYTAKFYARIGMCVDSVLDLRFTYEVSDVVPSALKEALETLRSKD